MLIAWFGMLYAQYTYIARGVRSRDQYSTRQVLYWSLESQPHPSCVLVGCNTDDIECDQSSILAIYSALRIWV